MKKKLLSLVLAGAMVASTSVSAFAQNKTITDLETKEPTTDVTITGSVIDDTDNAPTGTFNVTVPTTAAFTVTKEGDLQGVRINIENNGEQNIDVYAEKFVDTKPTEGIKVVSESELKSNNRTYVSLSITGKSNAVYLKSEDTNNGSNKGLYTTSALSSAASGEQLKLTSIAARDNGYLTLEGKAGEDDTTAVDEPIKNDFTLTLKIKKSAN